MSIGPEYELGILVGGTWRQWSNSVGQSYYENMTTRATQFRVPAGWEDAPADSWVTDDSKTWPQWRNARTGRIRRTDPYAPPPLTYLDRPAVQAHLRAVERTPDSQERLYGRVISGVLRHFFTEEEGFQVVREKFRDDTPSGESCADMAVLKIMTRPGGSMHVYNYCLVESKTAGSSWSETQNDLAKHCRGTDSLSGQVYGIIQIGLYVQCFNANKGVLTALSARLHLRNDITKVTTIFGDMRREPLPFQ